MKVYQDITILPDEESGIHFLWTKVFTQIHIALAENKTGQGETDIGLAFPELGIRQKRLGRKLRIFAPTAERLEQFNVKEWLDRLTDYTHVTSVREVPETIKGYKRYSRWQTQTSAERLARRASRRQGISYEQALKDRSGFRPVSPDAPYITLKSISGGQRFPLYIRREETEAPAERFTLYGMSKGGGVPVF